MSACWFATSSARTVNFSWLIVAATASQVSLASCHVNTSKGAGAHSYRDVRYDERCFADRHGVVVVVAGGVIGFIT